MRATPAAALFFAAVAIAIFCLAPRPGISAPDQPDPGLRPILAESAVVEKLAGGYKWTEGAVYDRTTNTVLFSDQPSSTLNRFDPKTGKVTVFRDAKVVPNGNIFDSVGRLLSCEHTTRRVSRTDPDGRIVTLAYEYNGKRLNSPNDLVIAADGAVYFTDPPYGIKKEQEELGFYGVFRIAPDGTLTKVADDFVKPNGLAFSPDKKTLYVDDTDRHHIRAFSVQPDGSLANGHLFAELNAPGKPGAPDGMKVDDAGRIFCTGPGGIWVFAPDGTKLGVIALPEVAANCAFGDKDGRTLYITASSSLYRIRLRNPGPLTGRK